MEINLKNFSFLLNYKLALNLFQRHTNYFFSHLHLYFHIKSHVNCGIGSNTIKYANFSIWLILYYTIFQLFCHFYVLQSAFLTNCIEDDLFHNLCLESSFVLSSVDSILTLMPCSNSFREHISSQASCNWIILPSPYCLEMIVPFVSKYMLFKLLHSVHCKDRSRAQITTLLNITHKTAMFT